MSKNPQDFISSTSLSKDAAEIVKRARSSSESTDEHADTNAKAEKEHFKRILNSYLMYRDFYTKKISSKLQFIDSLPQEQQIHLTRHRQHLCHVIEKIQINQELLHKIVADSTDGIFINSDTSSGDDRFIANSGENDATRPSSADMERVASILRQFVREWTSEGEVERKQSFGKLMQGVNKYLGSQVSTFEERSKMKILVPGAGLGRLAYDLASAGYSTQGNEYSMFMLIASHFILNRCTEANCQLFVPWIHQSCNNKSSNDQLRPLTMPDISPTNIPDSVEYSMTAGNFIEIYGEHDQHGAWDAIVTCFFIDTGHNILDYISTISKALRPGGYWLNLGPLLYHFADLENEKSLELSYEELRQVIFAHQFQFVQEDTSVECLYTANVHSMLTYSYKCIYFVAKKAS